MSTTTLIPWAGRAADVGREIGLQDDRGGDDGRGYERDEKDRFHQYVHGLVLHGDTRALMALLPRTAHPRRDGSRLQAPADPPARPPARFRIGDLLMITITASLTDAEREELSRKNAEQNKRSEANRR